MLSVQALRYSFIDGKVVAVMLEGPFLRKRGFEIRYLTLDFVRW